MDYIEIPTKRLAIMDVHPTGPDHTLFNLISPYLPTQEDVTKLEASKLPLAISCLSFRHYSKYLKGETEVKIPSGALRLTVNTHRSFRLPTAEDLAFLFLFPEGLKRVCRAKKVIALHAGSQRPPGQPDCHIIESGDPFSIRTGLSREIDPRTARILIVHQEPSDHSCGWKPPVILEN